MKITLELDQETFEKVAAMMILLESDTVEEYILDLMADDFYQYRREIADIQQGHYKDEEYQKILELYKN